MARTRQSAKAAGSRFEREVADYLNTHVDDRIDRRVKTGAADKGDIAGIRHLGQRVAIECKNTSRLSLGTWANEAETARQNDDQALAGVIAHKRHGKGSAGDQWVTMTLDDFIALLTGNRNHTTEDN